MSGTDSWDEAAIVWLARTRSGMMTAAERGEHAAWLLSDRRARAAWQRAQSGWDMAGLLADDPMIAEEMSATRPRHFWPVAVAASLLLLALCAGAMLQWLPQHDHAPVRVALSAGASPAKRILSDGSTVMLDAGSEVGVEYAAHSRRLSLPRGHAFFRVAHDRARPFIVDLGGLTVTALGTAFDISNDGGTRRISLTEGRILVKDMSGRAVGMKAGSQLIADGAGWRIEDRDLGVERAWASRRHLFDETPLGDAAATMNRYTAHMLLIDPRLTTRPVNGVFAFGDTEGFARAIAALNEDIALTSDGGVLRMIPAPKKISSSL